MYKSQPGVYLLSSFLLQDRCLFLLEIIIPIAAFNTSIIRNVLAIGAQGGAEGA